MTAALEGGEWSAARPGRTLPQEKPGTHFTGGWVGPRAGLDGWKIRKSEVTGKVLPAVVQLLPEMCNSGKESLQRRGVRKSSNMTRNFTRFWLYCMHSITKKGSM